MINTPNLTVDIIIHYQGGIVVIERKNEPKGLALPGGFVDVGETLREAAIREAKEETNLSLYDVEFFRIYDDPRRDHRDHNVSVVFSAFAKGKLKAQDDAKQAHSIAPKALIGVNMCFDHSRIIAEYLLDKCENI